MNCRAVRWFALEVVLAVTVLPVGLRAAETVRLPPASSSKIDFARDVAPLLKSRCQICHGAQQQNNGLRLDRKSDALRGGYSGPAILPRNSANSRLIRLVAGVEKGRVMPPAGERLTPKEIGLLRAWIDQGALWPEPASTSPPVTVSGDKRHWSFRPLVSPEPPAVRETAWVHNPIDAFVLARLEKENVLPAPRAGQATLLRRVSLDLTGLPPTPRETDEFLAAGSLASYEQVVDHLLNSPHFGEKWARHWLDQARYADSDGYEKDGERPSAWRYRHWVIEALNRDLPFDRFTIEQIAGDLLPGATIDQRVATGFHRNTLTNREGGAKLDQFRFEQILDRTNTLGSVWLGLTVGCAQCHDHKYDPISQREYYQLFSFFNTSEEASIEAPLPGELGPFLKAKEEYLRRRQALLDEYKVPELMPAWEEKLRYTAAHPNENQPWDIHYERMTIYVDNGRKILQIPQERRTWRQHKALMKFFLDQYSAVISTERAKELKFNELSKKLVQLDSTLPDVSLAPTIAEDPQPPKSHIHLRGDYFQPGIEVQPGVLAALPPLPGDEKPTRLALARWIVSRDNPLTARVAVNRIWQELLGRGLVTTSEDFGAQGERPSHPELLDWLAADFRDHGWSWKRTIKQMVMSSTYQQSSKARPELQERDPDNRLLARQNRLRLPGELIRDVTLAASGLLDTRVGGRSVKPPQPPGVAELGYSNAVKWVESKGADVYRRGLYVHFQRTAPYPFLVNFDAPSSNVTACRRARSDTPLQALNLLNDPVFSEAAQALAARLLTEVPGEFDRRLEYAYRLCLARPPKPSEQAEMWQYFRQQTQLLENDPKAAEALFPASGISANRVESAAWMGLSSLLLNLDEFITRE